MSVQNKNLSQSLSQDGYAVTKSVLPSDLLDTLRQQRDYVLAGYLISKSPRSPAMIYLSDTRRDNGCLRVIPGSHRCQHRLHALPVAHEESLSHIEDPDNIAYQSDESEVAVEVTAGDVVPIFQDDDEPYPFNRAPQQHRMLSSIQQLANEPEALCD